MSLPPPPGPHPRYPDPAPGPDAKPPKERGWLPWILGGVATLVVAAAVVVPIVLTSGDDAAAAPDGPGANAAVETVVAALNARDADALAGTACEDVSTLDRRKARQSIKKLDPATNPDASETVKRIKVSFERAADARVSGSAADADITVLFSNVPPVAQASMPTVTVHVELKNAGGWCVSDIKSQTERPTPTSR
jgi:hypothetical protein